MIVTAPIYCPYESWDQFKKNWSEVFDGYSKTATPFNSGELVRFAKAGKIRARVIFGSAKSAGLLQPMIYKIKAGGTIHEVEVADIERSGSKS